MQCRSEGRLLPASKPDGTGLTAPRMFKHVSSVEHWQQQAGRFPRERSSATTALPGHQRRRQVPWLQHTVITHTSRVVRNVEEQFKKWHSHPCFSECLYKHATEELLITSPLQVNDADSSVRGAAITPAERGVGATACFPKTFRQGAATCVGQGRLPARRAWNQFLQRSTGEQT